MNEEAGKNENKESSETETSLSEEVENGKNKHLIKCKFCSSKILNPKMGTYLENKFDLPMMTRKRKSDKNEEIQYETVNDFWQINDMYTFENISFSNTVENTKYLACADCEVGPVGYFNMDTKISYIALGRVHYFWIRYLCNLGIFLMDEFHRIHSRKSPLKYVNEQKENCDTVEIKDIVVVEMYFFLSIFRLKHITFYLSQSTVTEVIRFNRIKT